MPHFIASDGEKIHLKISGDGSPVVLLHGWTGSHQDWFPFLAALESRHRVHRWDARGHGGRTLKRGNDANVERMAADLHDLLCHYDLHDVTAVGHSMGALTLWQYLRDYGDERLARLCFIDQSPRLLTDVDWEHGIYGDFDHLRSKAFLARLEEDFAEAVLELTALGLNTRARAKYLEDAEGWRRSRERLRAQEPGPLIACWESLTAADYRDVIRQIRLPSLLVFGGESNFYRHETAEFIAARLPDSILHVYEGCDHLPHLWQRERFIRDLLAFIDRETPTSGGSGISA